MIRSRLWTKERCTSTSGSGTDRPHEQPVRLLLRCHCQPPSSDHIVRLPDIAYPAFSDYVCIIVCVWRFVWLCAWAGCWCGGSHPACRLTACVPSGMQSPEEADWALTERGGKVGGRPSEHRRGSKARDTRRDTRDTRRESPDVIPDRKDTQPAMQQSFLLGDLNWKVKVRLRACKLSSRCSRFSS